MRRRNAPIIAGLALCALTVAGCAGADDSATGGSSSDQWVDIAGQFKITIGEDLAAWDDAGCSPEVVEDEPGCDAYVYIMGTRAGDIQKTFEEAVEPGAGGYIGTPPAELEDVIDQTREAATEAATAYDSVDCPGPDCTTTSGDFMSAYNDLDTAFSLWDPYL